MTAGSTPIFSAIIGRRLPTALANMTTNTIVQQTVAAHNGNRAAAARQLGVSRTTLWRYLGRIEGEREK